MNINYPLVDIIIPIYKNLEVSRACIDSVLSSSVPDKTRIVIVHDASPEQDVVEWCKTLASKEDFLVIEHAKNLGFVASVNDGMRVDTTRDVVLLNSDTQVANDWLFRLQRAAYSEGNIGTVTPFTNNGSICSYPLPNVSNELVSGLSLQEVDSVLSECLAGTTVELPTAVGFCMYIRRDCLDRVGYFDVDTFGRGYGEENDFSLRAKALGYKNILAADVFVFHKGSVSFGHDRFSLMAKGEEALSLLHPKYASNIKNFNIQNPLEALRNCFAKMLNRYLIKNFFNASSPRLLFISHHWGGGVEQHLQDLFKLCEGKVQIVVLRGMGDARVELELIGGEQRVSVWQLADFDRNYDFWLEAFSELSFSRVHLHHIHGFSTRIIDLVQSLHIPIDITLHDYWCISPEFHLSPIKQFDAEAKQGSSGLTAYEWPVDEFLWRQKVFPLLQAADRIIAPSKDLVARVKDIYPALEISVLPHLEPAIVIPKVIKIALLGSLSKAKGLNVAIEVAERAKSVIPTLSFYLIGQSAEPLPSSITATGSYKTEQLPRLIAEQKPDIFWLPSLVHETFSYTLSVAMATGKPIVATKVGAFVERLSGYSNALLVEPDASIEEWLAALAEFDSNLIEPSLSKKDNFLTYQEEYFSALSKVFKNTSGEKLADLVSRSSQALLDPSKPIKNLFLLGRYGGHKGALDEVERQVMQLPDLTKQLAPYEDSLRLAEVEDALLQYQSALEKESQELAAAVDGMQQYKIAFEDRQQRLENALEENQRAMNELEAMQRARDEAQRLYDETQIKFDSVINSRSWKITRPLRVAVRIAHRLPAIVRRVFLMLKNPAAVRRGISLIRRGGISALIDRLKFELFPIQKAAVFSRDEKAEQSLLVAPSIDLTSIVLPTSSTPLLSIIIPVYGQHPTTYQCLASILQNPPSVPFEVIIADDCSQEPASEALAMVSGVRFIRHPKNYGFLGNMNAGAAAVLGEWLVLLNNDTVVCKHAFDALLKTFAEHENVGMVGAKLLNGDGTVQEAGGIIWRDGSGWNWGRNQHRDDPRFNFVREADYCSGAALAMRKDVFEELGGFDTHFAPAYYEDTDLAFRLREKGLRVLYQPAAEIYHLEGVSHGRDTNSGIKAYQKINAEKFFTRWQSVLEHHRENADQPELEAHRKTRGNILIIEACMITPDQDSGSIRMLNLLALLKRERYHVSFVAANLEFVGKYVEQLQQLGVEVFYNDWADGGVAHLLKKIGADLAAVWVCRHYILREFIDAIRKYAPHAKLVFDTVDLHFVREAREAELHQSDAMHKASLVTRQQELELIRRADVTLVVSAFEKNLLADLMPNAQVEIVSNIHNHVPERPDYAKREGIIFVGGFRHPPNIDAITWYVDSVLPILREKLPGVKTQVIGSNMPESIKSLASDDLHMLGFIENIDPYLQGARISIAPLRYGAGVKGKVNEAMNYGIPVVATACAVEGMHLQPMEEVMVAEDAEGFAEAIITLYHDKDLWHKLSKAGIKNVQDHFSPAAALPALKRFLG